MHLLCTIGMEVGGRQNSFENLLQYFNGEASCYIFMTSVVFITRSLFWRKGAGVWERTRALVRYLDSHFSILVVYVGQLEPSIHSRRKRIREAVRFVDLEAYRAQSRQELVERFRSQIVNLHRPRICVIDKTELAYFVQTIPKDCFKVLDTHDLISRRSEKAGKFGVQDYLPLTWEQEVETFKKFNLVLCIQKNEYLKVVNEIGAKRSLLAPHPVGCVSRDIRDEVKTVGFIASDWHANVYGAKWFLKNVWPNLKEHNLKMAVAGSIGTALKIYPDSDVQLLGHVDEIEDFYDHLDIVVNPVQYGAGLKIKTVEAFANGVPLVSTFEGVSGLEHLRDRCFLAADKPAGFVSAITRLINSFALRKELSQNALAYASSNFTPECCFDELRSRLMQIR